jgi:hypothetical protein
LRAWVVEVAKRIMAEKREMRREGLMRGRFES